MSISDTKVSGSMFDKEMKDKDVTDDGKYC